MSATSLLDPPHLTVLPGHRESPAQPLVLAGQLLGHRLLVHADSPAPAGSLARMVTMLDEEWDVRRRSSDLGRLTNRPNVVVTVSPVTVLLVRNVLTFVRFARRAGLDPGSCVALLDARHCRVGLDPLAAAIAARLAPASAADLIADFCVGSGAAEGRVQVGRAVRVLSSSVPAWWHQAVDDVSRGTGSPSREFLRLVR